MSEIVNTIPQLMYSLFYFTQANSINEGFLTFIFTAATLVFYTFLVFKLLFNTNYFVDKLKLDQGFKEEKFSLNISTSKVLTIALLVIAGVILINEIPNLCRQLFSYFQEMRFTQGMTKPDFSSSIIAAVKIIIAVLLIGERNRIIDFIEKWELKKHTNENE